MNGNSKFQRAVERAALELANEPEQPTTDLHIHFSHPRFSGLVPESTDIAWLSLAATAADVVAQMDGDYLIVVPLGEWEQLPEPFDLDSLKSLSPSDPPSIHVLRAGSAFAIRGSHSPGAWYRDVASTPSGALGWISGYRDDDAGVWRASLMYETVPK
jgi:hypothetical protein